MALFDETPPLFDQLAEAPTGGVARWLKADGRHLRIASWPGSGRGTVAIFPGRTEYIEKYGRVASALVERGFGVVVIDWRGQGLSERLLPDRLKGHVGHFSEFQSDVEALAAAPEIADAEGPLVLMCHSMGGCIGMRAVTTERIAPAAIVMSAPMLGIKMTPHLRLGAKVLIALSRRFGFSDAFAPAPNKTEPYVLAQPLEGNVLTNDDGHYRWMRKHLEAMPDFGLAAPTLRWMDAAFEEMAELAAAPVPEQPLLMFLGDEEDVVDPVDIHAHAARNPACKLVELTGCKHEGLMETDAIRALIWSEIDAFLTAQGI